MIDQPARRRTPTREELEARGRTVPPEEMTAEQIARLDELTAVADKRRGDQ